MRTHVRQVPVVDVGAPTAGFVGIGLSAFLLLAAGPRLVGGDEYSLMAVAWTVATVFGVGVGAPGEQTVTRVLAAGGGGAVVRRVARSLAVLTAVVLVGAVALGARHPSWIPWGLAVVVFAAGWAALAGVRGRLAARREFGGYAATQAAEALSRCGLVVLAVIFSGQAVPLLAAAIGLPIVVSAAVGAWRLRGGPAATASAGSHVREQAAITAVALLSQVTINAAPVFLQAQSADAALAGQFVTTTSYLRVPIMLVGGLSAVMLSSISAAYAAGHLRAARSTSLRAVGAGTLLGLLGVIVLLVVSGPALRVYYGSPIDLGASTLALIAVGTVLALSAGLLSLVAFGCERAGLAAGVWAVAAVATTVGLATAGGSAFAAAAATLVGEAIAVLGLLAVVVARLRPGPPPPAPGPPAAPH